MVVLGWRLDFMILEVFSNLWFHDSMHKPLQYFHQSQTKLNTFVMLSQRLLGHHELEFVDIPYLDQCDASSSSKKSIRT